MITDPPKDILCLIFIGLIVSIIPVSLWILIIIPKYPIRDDPDKTSWSGEYTRFHTPTHETFLRNCGLWDQWKKTSDVFKLTCYLTLVIPATILMIKLIYPIYEWIFALPGLCCVTPV